jgi:hypothetical protein
LPWSLLHLLHLPLSVQGIWCGKGHSANRLAPAALQPLGAVRLRSHCVAPCGSGLAV